MNSHVKSERPPKPDSCCVSCATLQNLPETRPNLKSRERELISCSHPALVTFVWHHLGLHLSFPESHRCHHNTSFHRERKCRSQWTVLESICQFWGQSSRPSSVLSGVLCFHINSSLCYGGEFSDAHFLLHSISNRCLISSYLFSTDQISFFHLPELSKCWVINRARVAQVLSGGSLIKGHAIY